MAMFPCYICGRQFDQFELELHVQNDHSAVDEISEYVDVQNIIDGGIDMEEMEDPTGSQMFNDPLEVSEYEDNVTAELQNIDREYVINKDAIFEDHCYSKDPNMNLPFTTELMCQKCLFIIQGIDFTEYIRHVNTNHGQSQCFHCKLVFIQPQSFVNHLKISTTDQNQCSPLVYKCILCPNAFKKYSEILQHVKSCTVAQTLSEMKSEINCSMTVEITDEFAEKSDDFDKTDLKSDVQYSMSVEVNEEDAEENINFAETELKCKNCRYVGISDQDIKDHVSKSHAFVCQYCSKKFKIRKAFELHIFRQHTFHYQCLQCQEKMTSLLQYELHLIKFHEGFRYALQ